MGQCSRSWCGGLARLQRTQGPACGKAQRRALQGLPALQCTSLTLTGYQLGHVRHARWRDFRRRLDMQPKLAPCPGLNTCMQNTFVQHARQAHALPGTLGSPSKPSKLDGHSGTWTRTGTLARAERMIERFAAAGAAGCAAPTCSMSPGQAQLQDTTPAPPPHPLPYCPQARNSIHPEWGPRQRGSPPGRCAAAGALPVGAIADASQRPVVPAAAVQMRVLPHACAARPIYHPATARAPPTTAPRGQSRASRPPAAPSCAVCVQDARRPQRRPVPAPW